MHVAPKVPPRTGCAQSSDLAARSRPAPCRRLNRRPVLAPHFIEETTNSATNGADIRRATASVGAGGHDGGVADEKPEPTYQPSPVPSDARLWPLELPFTAFGQFGEDALDLRVFDQDVFWVDRLGAPHLLKDMSQEYISNVIAFLTDLRDQYFADTQRRSFLQSAGDQILFDEPAGEVLAHALGAPTWEMLSAEEWLESTPLMRSLRRRLRALDGV